MHEMTASGIAYDDHGSGDTALLFLPGWCGPRTVFRPLLDRLGDDVRALAVDWRGHGDSKPADGDFGSAQLVEDALAVIAHSGVARVVPVGVAHAGWIGIELSRQLGSERIPALVFLDWMVTGAPAPFLGALSAMRDPLTTRQVVDQIAAKWVGDLDIPELTAYVQSMTAFPDEMWARAAGQIAAAFERHPVPLEAAAGLQTTPPTLHVYAQPGDPAFFDAQEAFAADHPWFEVAHLDASSHFPSFEVPDQIVDRLTSFVARVA